MGGVGWAEEGGGDMRGAMDVKKIEADPARSGESTSGEGQICMCCVCRLKGLNARAAVGPASV